MDLKVSVSAAKLLYRSLVQHKTDGIEQIPYVPQKTKIPNNTDFVFPTAYPSEVGLDGKKVLSFVKYLSSARRANVHSVLLIKDGKCVFDASIPGYDTASAHMTFSLCKTVTGLAVGMLIEQGKLRYEDRIADFFPVRAPLKLLRPRMRNITVRDLLRMSSGVGFAEAGAIVEEDWIKAFFESSAAFEPGTDFAYNSMNSFMLCALVCRISGQSLSDFLQQRLWEPLGITDAFWERNNAGLEKGGWGLYLSPRSMAKLGLLYLQGGVWEGKRIIGEDFINEATRAQTAVPDKIGVFDYGYHLWVAKDGNSYLFNGMLGQNVLVIPKHNIVLVMTAGDYCVFQDTPSLVHALELFGDEGLYQPPRRETVAVKKALLAAAVNFGKERSWVDLDASRLAKHIGFVRAQGLLGEYTVEQNNAGILPTVTRLVQNNHSLGISRVCLAQGEEDTVVLTVYEGDTVYTLRAGENYYIDGAVTVKGEEYRVALAAEWTHDQDRAPICKIDCLFPELANSRRFLFRPSEDGEAELCLFEVPGYSLVPGMLEVAADVDSPILNFVKARINLPYMAMQAQEAFCPVLHLTPRGALPHTAMVQHGDPTHPQMPDADVLFVEPKPKKK